MRNMMLVKSGIVPAFSNPLFRYKENGITIEYTGNLVGDTGVHLASGETYTALDNTTLFAMDVDVDDFTKVVTSLVTTFERLYSGATSFNQDISSWDTSNVVRTDRMFNQAFSFNQDIGKWKFPLLTEVNARYMFFNTSVFNQDLSGWCVPLIPSVPLGFDTRSALTVANRPAWGTCP